MSKFNGTKDPLTFGEALVEIAQRVSFGTEEQAAEVLYAIREEFDLLPPEPDPEDEEAAALAAGADPRDAELRRLRAQLAAHENGGAKKAPAKKAAGAKTGTTLEPEKVDA